jgi:hypothetical protein
MEICEFKGNPDLYGIGIRIGFYLQWFAGILANFLYVPDELSGIRFGLICFTAATFLALMIRTTSSTIVDIYITLLLCFGYYYFLIPLYIWRILTCFNTDYDPTRWAIIPTSRRFDIVYHLLLLAVSGYQLWFWTARVPKLPFYNCYSYGFIFSKLALEDSVLSSINIALVCIMIAIFLNSLVRTILFRDDKREGPDDSEDDSGGLQSVEFAVFVHALPGFGIIGSTN